MKIVTDVEIVQGDQTVRGTEIKLRITKQVIIVREAFGPDDAMLKTIGKPEVTEQKIGRF